jgi:hypothetical protein
VTVLENGFEHVLEFGVGHCLCHFLGLANHLAM